LSGERRVNNPGRFPKIREKAPERAVSRILSAPGLWPGGEYHLSARPEPGTRSALAELKRATSNVPYLALHPMGFAVPRRLRERAVGSYPTFSPLPVRRPDRDRPGCAQAVCFLWHCPSGRLTASPPACIPRCTPARVQGVTRHRALRCSDFPPPGKLPGAILRPFRNRGKCTPPGGAVQPTGSVGTRRAAGGWRQQRVQESTTEARWHRDGSQRVLGELSHKQPASAPAREAPSSTLPHPVGSSLTPLNISRAGVA